MSFLRGAVVVVTTVSSFASITTVATTAIAAPTAQDKALASTLFRDGKALMADKSYAAACPKLAASQQIDPQLGTLLNLALCDETIGKTASAWTEFDEAANEATQLGQTDRATFARSHATLLEAKLSRLRVVVRAPSPGLSVKVDGTVLADSAWGLAIPLDPGEHAVEASAPGKTTNAQKILLPTSAGVTSVDIGPLADAAPITGTSASAPPSTAALAPPSDGSSQRTLGYAVAAVGVVGLGIGTVFGIETFSKKSGVNDHCKAFCDATGLSDQSASHVDATVSTVAFGVGAAAAVIGLYLVLSAPHADEPSRTQQSAQSARPSTERRPADRTPSFWLAPQVGGLATGGTW